MSEGSEVRWRCYVSKSVVGAFDGLVFWVLSEAWVGKTAHFETTLLRTWWLVESLPWLQSSIHYEVRVNCK